jgi:hypothetical protein
MNKEKEAENFRSVEHFWIEMPDGVRLAARIWLPRNALIKPAPAVFEYIPYRKVDMVRARDERNHPYLAENGIVAVRVDMRGSGDSEGQMSDMYCQDELDDARHVIEWLTCQPWCNGKIGMFGTSWGGTASLQANVNAPDALKAIIAVCATHDRYEDDIHYMGGCLLTDSVEWGTTLPTILGAPPSANVGDNWFAMWKKRLEKMSFPLEAWLRHEDRGSFWRHGSVIHQSDSLSAPILCVGGWSDRYSNSVMSLVDRRPDLVWGIVGPWGHHYPDHAHPGPGIGFQRLMLDWWQHWLMKDNPSEPEWPKLRTWVRSFDPPADAINNRSGAWVQTAASKEITSITKWHLSEGGLTKDASEIHIDLPSNLQVGAKGADTGYFGRFGGLPPDQSNDDQASICFDTKPLENDCLIYGATELELSLESSNPRSQLCLRLNDVAPDGTSVRITWAIRNIALDDALDIPEHPFPLGALNIRVQFPTMAYRIKAGHSLRLAVSQSYWPMVWVPPSIGLITLLGGVLSLPEPRYDLESLKVNMPKVEDLPSEKSYTVSRETRIKRYPAKFEKGEVRSGWYQPCSSVYYNEIDTYFGYETRAEFRIRPDEPFTAICSYEHSMTFNRPDGKAVVTCMVELTSNADKYRLIGNFKASWDDQIVKNRKWNLNITRKYT